MSALVMPLMPYKPLETADFYGLILPNAGQYSILAYLSAGCRDMRHESFIDAASMAARTGVLEREQATIYHAVATYKHRHDEKGHPDGKNWGRKAENVAAVAAFFLDIDVGEGKSYATTHDAKDALDAFCTLIDMRPHIVVESSSNADDPERTGLHVYWLLDRDLSLVEWTPIARRLKEACRLTGLRADHARTSDAASLLRPVGTTNRKPKHGANGRPVVGQRVRFGHVSPELFDSKMKRLLGSTDHCSQSLLPSGEPPRMSIGQQLIAFDLSAQPPWFDCLDESRKLATLRSLLSSLPDAAVETRESWLAVGAALAGTTGLEAEDRFSLWADWSQRTTLGAEKWQADSRDEHKSRWDGLTRSGVRALINRAQVEGWTQEALRIDSDETFELVAAARDATGARMSLMEAQAYMRSNAVHVASTGTFLLNGVEMAKDAMDMTLAPRMPLGERGPVAASSMFKNGCGITVDYIRYLPGADRLYKNRDGVRFLNTWKEHVIEAVTPSDEDKQAFAKFILHIGNKDEETRAGIRRLFVKLCFLLKNPTRRIRHATLLIGANEGCGKTTLTLEIPRALFGNDNVRTVETRELSSDFNSYAQGAQILVLPELWLGNRKDALGQANGLKPLITDDHIPMVKKGRDGVMVDNCTTVFANSNHADAAVFGEKDRRYDVIATNAKMLPPELAKRLYELIRERPGALYHMVLAYGKGADTFDPNAPPPMTAAKARMVEAGRDVWVERIRDAHAAALGPFGCDVVSVPDIRRWLTRDFDRLPSDNRIREELLKLAEGAISMRAQKRSGDIRQQARVIVLRNIPVWNDAGPSAVYDHYAQHMNR